MERFLQYVASGFQERGYPRVGVIDGLRLMSDTKKGLENGPSRIVRSWASYLEPDRNWPNESRVASCNVRPIHSEESYFQRTATGAVRSLALRTFVGVAP